MLNGEYVLPEIASPALAVTPLEHLLTERDLAALTGLSVATVRRWRTMHHGPPYLKIGAAVRYRPRDVVAWIDSQAEAGS